MVFAGTVSADAPGEKTILVSVGGSKLDSGEKELDYLEVIDMDQLIQTFSEVYAEDLVKHIGLDSRKLPLALAVVTLLNLMHRLVLNLLFSGLD